jgi:cell division protease FtsH
VQVDPPDYKGRLEILTVHSQNKKLDPSINLEVVARRTTGFSGADLANLLNEAAIFTARRHKEAMTMLEIDDAFDRIVAGMEGKAILDGKFKRQTAYHEVGHALISTLLKENDPVQKVTVIPRGGSIGSTWSLPNEEYGLETRSKLLATISMILGGRAAEEVVFGPDEIDSGAGNDIQKLTKIARGMVTQVGMSSLGLVALNTDEKDYSEDVAAQIDRQVRSMVKECYQRSLDLLREHRHLMDILVEELIDKESLTGDEFRAIVERELGTPQSTSNPSQPATV